MPHEIINPNLINPQPMERHVSDGDTVLLLQLDGNYDDTGPNAYTPTPVGTFPSVGLCPPAKITTDVAAKLTDANYCTIPYDATIGITGEMTVMAMMRMDAATADDQTICMFAGAAAPDSEANNVLYWFYIDTGLNLKYFNEYGAGTNGPFITGTTPMVRSQWYHVAMTRSASGDIKLYVNGSEVGSGTVTMPTGGTGGDFYLGRAVAAADDMDGDLGTFIIKDVEMSAGDILTEANRLVSGTEWV